VNVYCNIHPEMAATIKVVDSPYFAVTGPDGKFKIENVPAGTYPLVGWQMSGDEFHGQVTVSPGGVAEASFELEEKPNSKRHLRKDGTPYGRYK
jgi:hypothetical protein